MSADLVIRQATPADAEAIATMCARAARLAYTGLATDDYVARVIAHFYVPDRIGREIPASGDWFGFVVAEHDAAVVGVSGTGRSAERPDACELFTLYVDPTFQRRGIGRALTASSVAQALDAGAASLDVAVFPGNLPAIRFYQACGFVAARHRPIYAPHGEAGGPADALVLTRRLSAD